MQLVKIGIMSVCFVMMIGCNSVAFVKKDFKESLDISKLEVDDQEIEEILKKRSNLPKPFKLGVYFQEKQHHECHEQKFSGQDKNKIIKAMRNTLSEENVSSIFAVGDQYFETKHGDSMVKKVRKAGAWYGADAVMIVRNHAATDTRHNSLAATYWLLAPMFFVPGSDIHALSVIDSSVFDVRNGYFYAAMESEGSFEGRYIPAYGAKECSRIKIAKDMAVENMVEKIELHFGEHF